MQLPPIIRQIDERLSGWPNDALTILLLLLAAGIVIVALYASPTLKAAVAAWVIAP